MASKEDIIKQAKREFISKMTGGPTKENARLLSVALKKAETSAAPAKPAPTRTLPIASNFRNAPVVTKITPEQQEKNTQVLLSEIQKSRLASVIPGIIHGSPLGLGGLVPFKYDPRVQQAIDNQAITYKKGINPRLALHYRMTKDKPDTTATKTYEQIGTDIGNLISVPGEAGIGAAAVKGISGLIKKGARNQAVEKIPILVNGKVRFVDAPTQITRNTPAPAPRIVPRRTAQGAPIQAASQPDIPIRTAADNDAPKPQPETITRNAQITPEPRKGNLGVVASQRQATAQNGDLPKPENATQESQKFVPLGADTNKYPPNMKTSEFKTNSIDRLKMFDDSRAELGLTDDEFAVESVSWKRGIEEANQRLNTDFEGEVADLFNKSTFDGVDTHTAMGVTQKYIDDFKETGDATNLKSWLKASTEKFHEVGQSLNALKAYERNTPEGALRKAQQTIDQVERDIKKKNPNLVTRVDKEVRQVSEAVKKAEEETVEELIQRYTAASVENLTSKIGRTVTGGKSRNIAPLQQAFNDLTNELYAIAKDALPESKRLAKREIAATDILKSAIENKQNYQEVWGKTKAELYKKYADNEDVMTALEQYFEKNAIPDFSKKTLDSAIKQTAKGFGADLGKIIKASKGDKVKLAKDIQDYVLYKVGVSGDDAKALADGVLNQYNAILKAKTESALKQMFPEAYGKSLPAFRQRSTLERVMDLINMGAYDNEAIKNVIRAKNNLPVLENSEIRAIVENMELSAKQTDPYMKNMYAAKAEQIISDKVPKEFREKFRALQRLSLILNPKTLITRNPLGNTLLGISENIKDVPASLIDIAVSKRTGQRTTTLSAEKMKAQAQGFGQGLKEWAQDIKYGVDTSPSRGQLELPRGRTFQDKGLGKGLNALDQFLIRGLQLGDRPFYQAAYNGRMAELKKLGVTGEEAEKQARLFALDRVFQNDSELSKRAVQIRKTLGLPGDLIMPFTQTPANILDKLIDYSPAGLAKALYQLGTTAGKGTFDQKKFVDTLARTFTGGGISLLTYVMMKDGMITGSLSDNKDVRNAQIQAGMQPYSVKILGKWYSYDWAQPIAGIIAATVDAVNAGADKDDISQAVAEGGASAVDSVFNQSFLSGLLRAFSGYSPASGIGAALLGSTSQATPTAGANLAKVIDPTARETYDPNMFRQQANRLIARIPLASKMLPAKLDITGQEIQQSQGRGLRARALENFLAPYRLSEETNDPVNAELMRLQNQTGDNAVLLNTAPKNFKEGGENYILNADDFTNYQRTMGQTAYRNVQRLIASPEYRDMNDDEKAKAVKDIQTEATERARMEFFKNKGMPQTLVLSESQQKKYSEVSALGVNEEQYIDTYYAQKDVAGVKDDNGKTIRLSESYLKKKAIDKANPGANPAELRALYHAFDVAEKVWGFN
jgi:hypothetical protein